GDVHQRYWGGREVGLLQHGARVVEGELDRVALAQVGGRGSVLQGGADRVRRSHDVVRRLGGVGGSGESRVELLGIERFVNAGADGPQGILVLEAGQVAQLVGGNGDREVDDVGAARHDQAGGVAQERVDVDDGRAAQVEIAGIQLVGSAAA